MRAAVVAAVEPLVAVLVALVVQAVAVLAVITTSTVQTGLQIQAAVEVAQVLLWDHHELPAQAALGL
jgi:hypothetical protein